MKLGMFMQPVHDPKRDLTTALEQDRETVKLADALGYCEVWVGEHTAATSEPITDPLVFLSTLIGETRQIKLGTGVYCLPHHHPAQIAAQAALFDHLSRGRFQMGIGNGSLSSDVELYGVGGTTDRGAMVRESIEHILAIWAGEPPYSRARAIIGTSRSKNVGSGGATASAPSSSRSSNRIRRSPFRSCRRTRAAPVSPASTAGSRSRGPPSCTRATPPVTGPLIAKARKARAGATPDPAIWRVSRSIVVAPRKAMRKRTTTS